MSTTQLTTRTPEQIADEALGSRIDGTNWSIEGPWAFDDIVFEAADRVRHTLTPDEEERMDAHVGSSVLVDSTLEALRGRPGGRNFLTSRIIIAMYWRMETWGLED